MGGTRIPVYISKINGEKLDLVSAVGQSYRIFYDSEFSGAIYTSKTGDEMVSSRTTLTIDSTGVDTLWVTVPLNAMKKKSEKVSLRVNSLIAEIEFLAPHLVFANNIKRDSSGNIVSWKIIEGDPDSLNGNPYANWIGSDISLSLLALNSKDSSLCSSCSFELMLSEKSSGLSIEMESIKNGEAKIILNSSEIYDDSTASFVIASLENPTLILNSYGNMRFLKPPVPYPVLVAAFPAVIFGAKVMS